MAKCCGGGGRCFCAIIEGLGITVTGTGAANNPYVITNDITQVEIGEFLAEVLSEYPDVIAAAVALAQSDAGLVHKTDPGIFRVIDGEIIVDGELLDMAILTVDDHLLIGWRNGTTILGVVVLDDITTSDGSVLGAGPTVPLDLFVLAGQSNSTDRSTFYAELLTPTPYVQKWNITGGEFETETYDPPWLGSGVTRGWSDRDAHIAGRRTASIPAGIGGSGFTETSQTVDGVYQTNSWYPPNVTAAVNLAVRARDMILDALAAAPAGSELKGIFWSQGEADRGSIDFGSEAQYGAALDDLIEWFRTELGMPNLPFIISPFTPLLRVLGNTSQTDTILAALQDTPRRVEYTAFALPNPDDSEASGFIHWSPDAQHRRGVAQISDPDPLRPSAWDCAQLNVGRTVAVSTTNGSNVVTSAGLFKASDLGASMVGAGIPAGAEILIYTSASSVTISANATATATPSVTVGAPARTPPGLKISRSGGEATITWGHPATRVTTFVLETATDGTGTSWNTETLTAPLTHTHVMAVAAGTPLWARITATTTAGNSYTSVVVKG